VNMSHNMNKDIEIKNYLKDDINESLILSKIENKHLIKVIDDLNDYNNYLTNNINYGSNNNFNTEGNINNNNNYNFTNGPKFKFMIISAVDLIPDLISYENKFNFIYMEEDEKKGIYVNNYENICSK